MATGPMLRYPATAAENDPSKHGALLQLLRDRNMSLAENFGEAKHDTIPEFAATCFSQPSSIN